MPDFSEVEPDVKVAWLAEQKEIAWREAYEEMRAKYSILLPAVPDDDPRLATSPAVRVADSWIAASGMLMAGWSPQAG